MQAYDQKNLLLIIIFLGESTISDKAAVSPITSNPRFLTVSNFKIAAVVIFECFRKSSWSFDRWRSNTWCLAFDTHLQVKRLAVRGKGCNGTEQKTMVLYSLFRISNWGISWVLTGEDSTYFSHLLRSIASTSGLQAKHLSLKNKDIGRQ